MYFLSLLPWSYPSLGGHFPPLSFSSRCPFDGLFGSASCLSLSLRSCRPPDTHFDTACSSVDVESVRIDGCQQVGLRRTILELLPEATADMAALPSLLELAAHISAGAAPFLVAIRRLECEEDDGEDPLFSVARSFFSRKVCKPTSEAASPCWTLKAELRQERHSCLALNLHFHHPSILGMLDS